MKTSDFYYDLPQELIAQTPIEKRDTSRLMTLDRVSGATGHHHFYDLPDYLNPGDCLILNNSRVLPARLLGQRLPGGGWWIRERASGSVWSARAGSSARAPDCPSATGS